MTSNTTTLFVKIQQVELSDSGFYFCGFWVKDHSRKLQAISSGTHLKVQGKIVVKSCLSFDWKETGYLPFGVTVKLTTNLNQQDVEYENTEIICVSHRSI